MTHNPIVKQSQLGLRQPEIGRTQQGVLQHHGQYRRLASGQKLSLTELMQLRNSTLFIVDCRTHNWLWEVSLPSQDDDQLFHYKLEITYRVINAEPVVRQNISDVERLLQQKLLPDLRLISGRARLHHYKEIARRIQDAILHHQAFDDYGLELDGEVSVTAVLSDADKKFIAELEQLIAARTMPRHATRTGSLPTQQALYKFEVEVELQYRLVDEQRIRSLKELETAVDHLWQAQIHKTLRRVSANYNYKQVSEADTALDNVLNQESFADFGIRVESATAHLQLDEVSRKAAEEDELAERKRRQEIEQKLHTQSTVMPNRMDLLASMYDRGEITLREMLEYMDDKEVEAAGIPVNLIEKLREMNILDQDVAEDAARALVASTLAAAATKQMPDKANELLEAMVKRAHEPIDNRVNKAITADDKDDKWDDSDDEEE